MSKAKTLRVLFHGNCFDGVASAAVFARFYRERVGKVDTTFYAVAHTFTSAELDARLTADENAIVDFRYSASPRLTWWFDHHISAFSPKELEAHFRKEEGRQKFWDPTAKSCTKFIARTTAERLGFDPALQQSLIEWADVIDSASFADARTAVLLEAPALRLMLVMEGAQEPAFLCRLAAVLVDRPLEETAALPWVVEPFEPLYRRHREQLELFSRIARCEHGVVTYDLSDYEIDALNKFLSYYFFPDCRYSVGVTRSKNRAKVSIGSNPWAKEARTHNLASIAERYGGGGHPVVAAISKKPEALDEIRRAAKEVAAELSTPGGGAPVS